ncbi:MAG: 4Fe-4S ferredoxin, partial [Bacteroidetes bacterium]
MKNNKQHIWIGTDQLNNSQELSQMEQSEFAELPANGNSVDLKLESNRRDFLKYLGFGIGAATIAACDIPVRKAVPYVVKPDTIVPGVATYYASSFVQGGDYCPILVKTREGRPIKIEGNSLSSITKGGTSARAQAMVLSLYDTSRFDGPRAIVDGVPDKKATSWADLDAAINKKLKPGARVRIVSNTILSPTTKQAVADFKATYPNTELVSYDPVSASALLQANEESFGQRAIPEYMFDKADVIVAIDCDFLGTWLSPIEFARQYASRRKPNGQTKMSRHIQIESYMSLTGSNADNRIPLKPSQIGAAIVALYGEVAQQTGAGGGRLAGPKLSADQQRKINTIAKELVAARGKSLVVCGSNNKSEQILVNGINAMLNNYGRTLSFARPLMTRQGDDKAALQL